MEALLGYVQRNISPAVVICQSVATRRWETTLCESTLVCDTVMEAKRKPFTEQS